MPGLGAGPGISSITGRYFVDKLDSVESINVHYAGTSLAKTSNLFPFSPVGIMRIYISEPAMLKDGRLIRVPRQSGKESVLFPERNRYFSRNPLAGLRYSVFCMRNQSHFSGLSGTRD